MDKRSLRKEMLLLRKSMDQEEVHDKSITICNKIIQSDMYMAASSVCLYMPIQNEVDVTIIFSEINKTKDIYLPRIIGNEMDFYLYSGENDLICGKYNILEPKSDIRLNADDKALIIMPGAVFSKNNKRIGYGGGYYDRYLEKNNNVRTIAVAYDFQVLEDVPAEDYDIKPELIITERKEYVLC